MSEDSEEFSLFDYDSLEQAVESLAEDAVNGDSQEAELRAEVASSIVSRQWRRKAEQIEEDVIDEMTEDVQDAVDGTLALKELESSSGQVEEVSEEHQKSVKEVADSGDPEVVEEKDLEMSEDVEIDPFNGVETLQIGDYSIRLDGQSEGVHKQALYVAQQLGMVEDVDMGYQKEYMARKNLEEDGHFTLDDENNIEEAEEITEEAREQIRQKLAEYGYIESVQDNPQDVSDNENGKELIYSFAHGTLQIDYGEETYEVPVDEEPTMEALGALAGVFKEDRIKHIDERTGSKHINEEHYRAITELQDSGIVKGTETEGFEVQIDLTEQFKEDIKEIVAGQDVFDRENVFEGEVYRINSNGDALVRYQNGTAKIPEPSRYLEPSDTVPIRISGKVDGQERAVIV